MSQINLHPTSFTNKQQNTESSSTRSKYIIMGLMMSFTVYKWLTFSSKSRVSCTTQSVYLSDL